MNEDTMTKGVIPVRHSSLPGLVKLPRRYEKAALGDPRTAKHRKVSICAGPLHLGETLSARLDDLTMAIMWVKQELILLRQHDILLKHQFFNIHDSIQSMQIKETPATKSALITASIQAPTSFITNGDYKDQTSALPERPSTSALDVSVSPSCREPSTVLKLPTVYLDHQLNTFLVRSSSSVTILNSKNNDNTDSEDDDGDDTFVDKYYRPRTSSMRTSRDLAALARRRGSKELI